jgi:hypothetical protein
MARLNIGASRAFVQIEGLEHLRAKLQKASGEVLRGCVPVLFSEARDVLSASKAGLPADSGELGASGFVTGVEIEAQKRSATILVGYESPHAAFAHEGFFGFPGKKDSYGRTGQPPKFLEKAARGRGPGFARKIGAAMVAALKRLEGK